MQFSTFFKVQDGKHQFNVLLKDIVNFSHLNLKTRNFNKKYTVQIKKIGRSLLSDFEEEKLQ